MPLPLLAIAAAASIARAGAGIFGAHKRADKRRATIYDAYNRGKSRLDLRQHDVREGTVESLGSRGLAASGGIQDTGAVAPTPVDYGSSFVKQNASIRAAMERKRFGLPDAVAPAAAPASAAPAGPHTLGEQQLSDLKGEQLLEQNDLLAARDNGIDDASAEGTQQAMDSIAAGINTGMQVYGAGKELGAMRSANPSDVVKATTAAQGAAGSMLPGVAGVGTIRGAFGIDPITAQPQIPITPGPAVNPALNTVIGDGQSNYDFRRY